MNKFISTFLAFFIFLIVIDAQQQSEKSNPPISWEKMMLTGKFTFKEIRDAFYRQWDKDDLQREEEGEGEGYKLFKRWEYWMEYVADLSGNCDWEKIRASYDRYKQSIKNPELRDSSHTWQLLGPYGFISNYGVGRVNVVAFDPVDENILWIGTPAGGLWKSEDGGASWQSLSDSYNMMGVSDIAINPGNPDTMFIATGDRDGWDTRAQGVLRSVDKGNTWTKCSLPYLSNINRVVIDPNAPNVVLVACNEGIFLSQDGGDSWQNVLGGENIKDLQLKPLDGNIIYATSVDYELDASFYKSTDGGLSFQRVLLPEVEGDIDRMAIGVTPADPDRVYLLLAEDKQGWGENDYVALLVSYDQGSTFEKVDDILSPLLGSQCWYDWTLAVSPVDPDILFAGGVNLLKSTDGGKTWQRLSNGQNPDNDHHLHVDQHFTGFHPLTGDLYAGNDGGVYVSHDNGRFWESLNNGISITQYYKMSSSWQDSEMITGGSQDNGTHLKSGDDWKRVLGGDGMDNVIDYTNDNIVFASWQFGYFLKSYDRGNTFFQNAINPNITNENGAWVTPMVQDPVQPFTFYAGYQSMWRSDDKGDTWDKISDNLNEDETIRSIVVAPTDNDFIYIRYWNKIFASKNGGTSWEEVKLPEINAIKAIAVSPRDARVFYAVIGYNVYRSTDAGASWQKITKDLPYIPMTCITVQGNDKESIYLGTFGGVFYTDNEHDTWIPFNEGMPEVRIGELEIDPQYGKIRAATFGRGIWETTLYDFDQNMPLCTDLVSPVPGSKVSRQKINLYWQSRENANGYRLKIGSQPGAGDILDVDAGNQTEYTWDRGDHEGKFYIDIITYNDYGETHSCHDDYLITGCYFEDRKALVDFYNSTGGDSWINKWDTTQCDITQWYGVITNGEGRVVYLDFDGKPDGKISAGYGGNDLTGYLPPSISGLKYLKGLFLAENYLSGSIPSTMGELSELKYFDISYNNFRDTFPEVLTKLTNLNVLDISGNEFYGEIDVSFLKLKNLKELYLFENNFSGPVKLLLGSLKKASIIDISSNNFSGSLPYQLWYSKNLNYFDASYNKISGKLSKLISKNQNLYYLNLSFNEIGGTIPASLGKTKCYTLNFSNNKLEGCFDNNLKALCSRVVSFSGNPGLPGNGDFQQFCSGDKGNCAFIPACVPNLIFLNNNADSVYYDEKIKWAKADKATGYILSIGTTKDSFNLVYNLDVGDVLSYDAGAMPKETRIYVKILPYNDYGYGVFCDTFSFKTTIRSGVEETSLEDESNILRLYPNPAGDFVVLQMLRPLEGEMQIEISDITGKKIQNVAIESGVNSKVLSLSGLESGVYLFKIKYKGNTFFKKMIVR